MGQRYARIAEGSIIRHAITVILGLGTVVLPAHAQMTVAEAEAILFRTIDRNADG